MDIELVSFLSIQFRVIDLSRTHVDFQRRLAWLTNLCCLNTNTVIMQKQTSEVTKYP